MEQNFQEQTSGHHSYCLRLSISARGQGACIIFSGFKEHPLEESHVKALCALQKEHNAHVELFYHIPASLTHYGKVDSLVTAGAMDDFVHYVQGLEQEEAEAFFAGTKQALTPPWEGIYMVREPHDWKKALKLLCSQFERVLLYAPCPMTI